MSALPVDLPKAEKADNIHDEKIANINTEIIHLSLDYDIPPQKLSKFLTKNIGDLVNAGEVIAVKKSMLGSDKIFSKISGTITKIDLETGDLYIRTEAELLPANKPIEQSPEICDNDKTVKKSGKNLITAVDAVGKNILGEILSEDVLDEALTEKVNDKILVTEKIDNLGIFKSVALGALGVLTTEIKDTDFLELSEKHLSTGIFVFGEAEFAKLKKLNGKKVFGNIDDKTISIV